MAEISTGELPNCPNQSRRSLHSSAGRKVEVSLRLRKIVVIIIIIIKN